MSKLSITQHYSSDKKGFITRLYNDMSMVNNNISLREVGFVDPLEFKIITELAVQFSDLIVHSNGGYEGAERRFVVVAHKDIYYELEPPSIYGISYAQKFNTLEHGSIMGTIYNCSIDIKHIGDILLDEDGRCEIIINEQVIDSLIAFVPHIANSRVKFDKIDMVSIISNISTEKQMSISSARLDLVVKELCKKSRSKIQDFFKQKEVKLNHSIETSNSKVVKAGDVISVRGFGRITVIDIRPTSKGKVHLTYI